MAKIAEKLKALKDWKLVDFPFLFTLLVLLAIGLIALSSASSYYALTETGDSMYYLKRQLGFAAFGLAVMAFVMTWEKKNYKRFSYLAFIIAGIFMVLVEVPGLGVTVKGAKRWLNLGVTFQPSEVLKLGLIMALARYISENQKKMKSFKGYLAPLGMLVGTIIFTYLQSHMSAMIVMCVIFGIVMLCSGFKINWKIVGPLIVVGIIGVGAFFLAEDYRRERIFSYLNPDVDITGSNWQPTQSLYAIGSGGLFGKGLGQSRQKYLWLPEAQNDFVFSVYAEEFGFVGSLVVIILFIILIYRGVSIGLNSKDMYGMLVTLGIIGMFAFQIIINIAVVTKTMPTTGMPLPFFSSGGTSLVINLIAMGIVLGISKENK
ncbi:MAG: putative lipid II flippase FtsW [Clostridia bacterium]|nr:putative lipid II flippase FtsW [Clostridia bacterium]MBR6641481.1 putative lipid II flippase FtsW [Clostridia bacterium]